MLRRLLSAAFSKQSTPSSTVLSIEQDEALAPRMLISDGDNDVWYCTPSTVAKWRVDTFFTKEPDTVEWISTFAPGEVFVDVGANVGMYTIWAAKTRGACVYAFEPESQNYALLHRNIAANGLFGQVTAYCAALSDEEVFSVLHLSEFSIGGSLHSFDQALDYNLRDRPSTLIQGCYSTTLDALVERGAVPPPAHIKIDVDGIEHRVIAGMRATLGDPRTRSVLIEINSNLPQHRAIVDEMEGYGFSYSREGVAAAQRREGPFKGVGNYVFKR